MNPPAHHHSCNFVSYRGVKLPLKLVNPIGTDAIANRNTYFCGYYDEAGKMLACEKQVYGEVESATAMSTTLPAS